MIMKENPYIRNIPNTLDMYSLFFIFIIIFIVFSAIISVDVWKQVFMFQRVSKFVHF